MCFVEIAAVASTVFTIGSSISNNKTARQNAAAQAAYNSVVEAQNRRYRGETLLYQDEVWQQDIDYANDTLAWASREWNRSVKNYSAAAEAIEKNTLAATGALMLRQVEEDIANVMGGMQVQSSARAARASAAVKDRGVEGSSVDAILNDVTRQEGEVLTVMEMNRSASRRQLVNEAIAADAQGDQSLMSLQLQTFSPATPIRSPAPVSPVNPAAPVAGVGSGAMIGQIVGGIGQGVTNYANWNKTSVKDVVDNAGSWLGRQFTL